MKSIITNIAALLAAAVTVGIVNSILQTQLNLGELSALGAPLTTLLRAWTTLEDLARSGPVMIGIALAALLPATLVGHLARRMAPGVSPRQSHAVFATAAVGLSWLVFWLMRSVVPMPAIPGTREQAGHLLLSLTGMIGGVLYSFLMLRPDPTTDADRRAARRRHALAATALVLVPVALFFAMAPVADSKPESVTPASYRLHTVLSGLNRPWSIAFLPDGRMFVTEMGGRLLAVTGDGASSQIALDGLPAIFHKGASAGLMDVALDPQFGANGWLYLTMGYGEIGANGTRLVRARLAQDKIEDVRVLFSSTPKPGAGNNGGRLAFLRDATLVLTIGDGNTRREEAQNRANHLGTVVRLTRDGRAPADNPFVGQAGAAPELYSLGHRNPQGIAIDPATGELLLSEHGPRGGDEINRIVAGANYGWPLVSGGIDYPFARVTPFRQLARFHDPLLTWTPSIAPAGLAVYDGALFAGWRGDLLVPALRERAVRRVLRDGRRIVGQQLLLAELNERIRDVKVGPDGAIYVLTDGENARLLRLTPSVGH